MSIQNNTTKLQEILETVNALPEAGNVDNEEVSEQTALISEILDVVDKLDAYKYYTVTYSFDEDIASSNTLVQIKDGSTYETTLSILNDYCWDIVTVTMNDETVFDYPNHDSKDINIVIENVTGDIIISATTSYEGIEEWE